MDRNILLARSARNRGGHFARQSTLAPGWLRWCTLAAALLVGWSCASIALGEAPAPLSAEADVANDSDDFSQHPEAPTSDEHPRDEHAPDGHPSNDHDPHTGPDHSSGDHSADHSGDHVDNEPDTRAADVTHAAPPSPAEHVPGAPSVGTPPHEAPEDHPAHPSDAVTPQDSAVPHVDPHPPAAPPGAHHGGHDDLVVARYGFEQDEDRDYDYDPDSWTRRGGSGFPGYVKFAIDQRIGHDSPHSLRCALNGGAAAMYSPVLRVDPQHTYSLSASIRSVDVAHTGAAVSLSVLNGQRQRIDRLLTRIVVSTSGHWQPVRIDGVSLPPEARFLVIGCHIIPSDKIEIRGDVWFDDLLLERAPRLTLQNHTPFVVLGQTGPLNIDAIVSGLQRGQRDSLNITVTDLEGKEIDRREIEFVQPDESVSLTQPQTIKTRHVESWTQNVTEPGFYRVRAALHRGDKQLNHQETSVVVCEPLTSSDSASEFGWSLSHVPSVDVLDRLGVVASHAQCGWLKVPVWKVGSEGSTEQIAALARMFDNLIIRGVRPVGVLDEPPSAIRKKFANAWGGANDVFSLPPTFWSDSLKPTLARYSTTVRHWQLGGEYDYSFVGVNRLDATVASVIGEINHVGVDAGIGLPWTWSHLQAAGSPRPRQSFVSLSTRPLAAPSELTERLQTRGPLDPPRWVLYRGSHAQDPAQSAANLVRWMTAAKRGGAEAFFQHVDLDDPQGLLRRDGTANELFMTWRAAAAALRGTTYAGSLLLPNRSSNAVFFRKGEAIVVAWNVEPVVESMYFGSNAAACDLWGRKTPLPADGSPPLQRLTVETDPVIVRGCHEGLTRWRMAVGFAEGRIRSENGQQPDQIIGRNTFDQGVSGKARLIVPDGWDCEPGEWEFRLAAGEPFAFPVSLTLPLNASLGPVTMGIEFQIDASESFHFRLEQNYQVGLGDVELKITDRRLPDGRLEISQVVINKTSPPETLDLRCSLFVPGERRLKQQVTKLGLGEDQKWYRLPNADRFRGQQLWLRLEQDGGKRVMNYRWRVGENWD